MVTRILLLCENSQQSSDSAHHEKRAWKRALGDTTTKPEKSKDHAAAADTSHARQLEVDHKLPPI